MFVKKNMYAMNENMKPGRRSTIEYNIDAINTMMDTISTEATTFLTKRK